MCRKIFLSIVILAIVSVAPAQLDTSDIKIVGFVHSDQLCMLTNLEKRVPSHDLNLRSVVVGKDVVDNKIELTDSVIINLLREKEAYMYYGDCYHILNDVFHKFCENDSVQDLIRRSHPIRFFEFPDGGVFSVIDKVVDYITPRSIPINRKYSYQEFNTECFLLVSAPYRICFKKQPCMSYGDYYHDFWLSPESSMEVVVIIPLICDNN